MDKKVPEITESVEAFKSLFLQAKQKHERQRLNALYLLKSGQGKKIASKLLRVKENKRFTFS